MEWLLLIVFALVAAALIALPRRSSRGAVAEAELAQQALLEERRLLLAELRDLDEDAAADRISTEDRLAGRRALAPRLRAVTEALRAAGLEAAEPLETS